MDSNSLDLAAKARRAYATDYTGTNQRVFKNFLSRHQTSGGFDDSLPNFVRMKGPYLQALSIPRRSDTPWETFAGKITAEFAANGLDPQLVDTVSETGIEYLYAFQQRAMQEILDDNSALITASTGRGKTESWLIPILQFILEAKEGLHPNHPKNSVKCVLNYPTKALAQDQLKRLIHYLYKINRDRPKDKQITVGIRDGDTPKDDGDAYSYLHAAFKYFECPCEHCSSSLKVTENEDGRKILEPSADLDEDVSLDFIYLTREDILEEKVDILLTNPDTINFRLFNINAKDGQDAFVKEPKFMVFDEVHEYQGLFGSFTSVLMRRYLQMRERLLEYDGRDHDDLRIIAASATVKNKEELFQKINPLTDRELEVIAEKPRQIDADIPPAVPDVFLNNRFRPDDLKQSLNADEDAPITARLLELTELEQDELTERSETDIQDAVGNRLFAALTSEDCPSDLEFIRGLYSRLKEEPLHYGELKDTVRSTYDLSAAETDHLINNFISIGQLSGILENRAHLFSWPIDGYYSCINCGQLFDSPHESCPNCEHHFVTKLSFCNVCGEEALESWFCPECQIPIPLTATSEGQFEYNQTYECNCGTETIRTIWRPYYRCTSCGNNQTIDRVRYCDDCDSVMVLSDGGEQYTCSNPGCEFTTDGGIEVSCSECASQLEVMKGQSVAYCDSCDRTTEDMAAQRCECGGELNYFRYLGWACKDLSCDEIYFNEPPSQCSCGKRRFVLRGLMDITQIAACSNCDDEVVRTKTCSCEHPDMNRGVRAYTAYKMIDENWRIRDASGFPGAVPCYHKGRGYAKNGTRQRYNALLRSPQNIAVTTSQYLLRDIVDPANPESYEHSKVLSFSDSHSDMKELTRDFNDPEEELVIDQLVVEGLLDTDQDWIPLADLQDTVIDRIEKLQDDLSTDQMTGTQVNLLNKLNDTYNTDGPTYVKNEVTSRVLNGFFNRPFYKRPSHYPLTNIGLLNVRLDHNLDELTDEETAILQQLVEADSPSISSLRDKTEIPDLLNHVEGLVEKDLVIHDDSTLEFNKEKIECTLVSDTTPIQYRPSHETNHSFNGEDFKTDLWLQFNELESERYVPFQKGLESRADFSDEHFSRQAYKIAYSAPMMLWSEAYYGHTDKKTRREREYRFSQGRHPHFLSSGPAMEVGIDIGDLDSLLLFGAPPNTNSYIQRIGRAGRRSGTSLIHSVSKRNPIDYYYFERPEDLIQSDPQPVPLNEVNQEVVQISLTWALLDYIAANYWIPWREEETPQGTKITDGEEFKARPEPRLNDIIPFTKLANHTNSELAMQTDSPKLDVLRIIIHDERDKAREWLKGVVDFNYCSACGAKYDSGYQGQCSVDDCGASLVSAKDEFGDTIDDVIDDFAENLIEVYQRLDDEIWEQRQQIGREIDDIDGKLRRETDDEKRVELQSKRRSLQERKDQLRRYNDRITGLSYFDFLKSKSRYAFGLRSVSDSVDYELLGEDFEPERDDMQSRNVRQALSELHPGAAYLYQDQNYIVTRVWWDDFETSQITDVLPDTAVCLTCGEEYDDLDKAECDYCDTTLRRRTTKVPSRAVAYRGDLTIGEWPDGSNLQAHEIYRNSDAEVQGTFAERETEVIDFHEKESTQFDIVDEDGVKQGELDYGEAIIVSTADSYRANYKGGGADPLPNLFEVCGVRNCNGVIKRDGDTAFCSHDINHEVSESEVVKLAHQFETKGIRVRFDDETLEHSFAHGLRLALQYIGGVGIRQIPESIEEDGSYIFEVEEGGSGITVLLTLLEEEGYENFKRALEIMRENVECDCGNGCPLCMYQYGCDERNNPETLDRENLQTLLDSNLSLVNSEETADE